MTTASKTTEAGARTQEIKEGDPVIHEDFYGQSQGIADSEPMRTRLEIKINFTSGPRAGECRWVALSEVTKDGVQNAPHPSSCACCLCRDARNMTAKQRQESARAAVNARWEQERAKQQQGERKP